jgi:hypothetical protein
MEYPKIYNICGNTNSPYQVKILSRNSVHVHERILTHTSFNKLEKVCSKEFIEFIHRVVNTDPEYNNEDAYSYLPSYTFDNVVEIFIGKSPLNHMTEFSGGNGPHFDGNTFLLHLGGNEYIYIGDKEIRKFTTKNTIIAYNSPVGNNRVPYPYATDDRGMVYLMIENVIMSRPLETDDPYEDYYNKRDILRIGHPSSRNSHNFAGITEYFIRAPNDEWCQYNLTYTPTISHREFYSYRITQNGTTRDITTDELQQIMADYAGSIGIEPLNMTTI